MYVLLSTVEINDDRVEDDNDDDNDDDDDDSVPN